MSQDTRTIIKISKEDSIRFTYLAINHLYDLNPSLSARSIKYKRNISIKIIILISLSHHLNILMFSTNLIYLVQNLFKMVLLIIHNPCRAFSISYLNRVLPTYTVLIPLYKEVGNIKILNEGIARIIYPLNCLDIIVIVEEDDKETIQEINIIDIEVPIRVVLVPYSLPRTKPKALNYAFNFIRGKFITIYDAEDLPDSDQLLKAIQMFNKLPDIYVCLQARLNFYNKEENVLTRFFSLEYFLWFNCLLAGLEKFSLPISLGGTSNHFKSDILRKVGLWDPYNVTEDADLGIRLYMRGYKTKLLDSYSLEESPIDLLSWLLQRTRWIKGLMQTIMVYVKVSIFIPNKMKKRQHLSIIIFLICSTYSFYILPIIILILHIDDDIYYKDFTKYNIYIALIYVYMSSLYGLTNLANRRFRINYLLAFILSPVYFILHVIASYLALVQLITNPFKWNKTQHGVSKLTSRK